MRPASIATTSTNPPDPMTTPDPEVPEERQTITLKPGSYHVTRLENVRTGEIVEGQISVTETTQFYEAKPE